VSHPGTGLQAAYESLIVAQHDVHRSSEISWGKHRVKLYALVVEVKAPNAVPKAHLHRNAKEHLLLVSLGIIVHKWYELFCL
jgi:hypothetical protein